MSPDPPISFDSLAKSARNPAAGGYPYSIRGTDLDKNFVYATADFDTQKSFKVLSGIGAGGLPTRKVSLLVPVEPGTANGQLAIWNGASWIPSAAPPPSGTHVLGALDGALQWIATEEC